MTGETSEEHSDKRKKQKKQKTQKKRCPQDVLIIERIHGMSENLKKKNRCWTGNSTASLFIRAPVGANKYHSAIKQISFVSQTNIF